MSNDLERANAKSTLAARELCNPTRGAPINARASRIITAVDDQFVVNCPYCGEDVEIYIEPDVQGIFAWWHGDDVGRVWRVASRYRIDAEAAEALRVPVGTVRSRLFRAREALADRLKEETAPTPAWRRVLARFSP